MANRTDGPATEPNWNPNGDERHRTQPSGNPNNNKRHLTQLDLARRWRLSTRTLERWRSSGTDLPISGLGRWSSTDSKT